MIKEDKCPMCGSRMESIEMCNTEDPIISIKVRTCTNCYVSDDKYEIRINEKMQQTLGLDFSKLLEWKHIEW